MSIHTHTEIMRQTAKKPPVVVQAGDPQVQSSGSAGRHTLDLPDMAESPMQLLILSSAGSWAEITWMEPTTVVGVQFWGDSNDGFARIWVNGEEKWHGNTRGGSITFEQYIEIDDLPNTSHTIRVEATGQPGQDGGGIDVTIASFGWGSIGGSATHTVYIPIVQNQ